MDENSFEEPKPITFELAESNTDLWCVTLIRTDGSSDAGGLNNPLALSLLQGE